MENNLSIYNYEFSENKKAKEPLLWIGLVSIIMFFAGLTSAVIVSSTSSTWKIFTLPNTFWYSSIAIIISSITFQLGYSFVKKNNLLLPKLLFISTLILGFTFVYFQYEGLSYLYQQGIYATGNKSTTSSSYLYVLTVLHIFHLFFGIISLGVVTTKSLMNKYNSSNFLGIKLSLTYWHFLGILWLYLFMFLTIMMSK
ncbi:MAG: cytochrome c oxidase subunit 3 [Flavobacteriaceae bacterium]|nr:cytochrome c oxidase subunit 3 [Flavobacteriaceae bacterium]